MINGTLIQKESSVLIEKVRQLSESKFAERADHGTTAERGNKDIPEGFPPPESGTE